jgi:hypothetical protein
MATTKFGLKSYYKPTPTKLRKIGDALLVASVLVSTQYPDNPKAILISSITGIVGKFLTNLFQA